MNKYHVGPIPGARTLSGGATASPARKRPGLLHREMQFREAIANVRAEQHRLESDPTHSSRIDLFARENRAATAKRALKRQMKAR